MDDATIKRFLRYYWKGLVDYAIDLAELDDREREAVELCGRRRLTAERAAEMADPPVSVNCMANRWRSAKSRLKRAWCGLEWVQVLADTVED